MVVDAAGIGRDKDPPWRVGATMVAASTELSSAQVS